MSSTLNYSGELYRKSLHLLSLFYPVGYVLWGRSVALWVLIPLSITAIVLDLLRAKNSAVHAIFDRYFGFMMRPEERAFNAEKPAINGASWVTASFTVLILFFSGPIAIVSFVTFMIGDAMAALVGRKIGKHPLGSGGSSWEGTLSFMLSGLLVSFLLGSALVPFAPFYFPAVSLIGAVLVAGSLEAAPLPVNDNIVAPFGAALFLLMMGAI
ncbi:MAG: SEC59/DGK1/VTE5 family protein [Bacteroidetes bacterium]|nr:SEC59/DGK1/VTE5 family protein [Bacteroidota bacterium]